MDQFLGSRPIQSAVHLKKEDRTNSFAEHLRCLYQQALYGYCDQGKRYVSQLAQKEYEKLPLHKTRKITEFTFRQQKQFDKLGRRDGKFKFEHVYTIWMFQRAIERLPEGGVTEEAINQIVKNDYAVAWITKEEDKKLNSMGRKGRIDRGEHLADALRVYSSVGIHLVDENGEPVLLF
jgi:hypothetical protein